ncbi:MAG: HAD-IC family P-type ATPase [Acidimicrobiales bacterium]
MATDEVDLQKASIGLSSEEVADRIANGQTNQASATHKRSAGQILAANALTPVNAIMLVLFVLVIISGNWRDGLFVGVVLSNTVVGVSQEVKARRELERLQVLTEPKATVIRDGSSAVIDSEGVVIDDVIALAPGGQVAVDGVVLAATGLQLDESMLTGESESVPKDVGDEVLSGSFVVAGSGKIEATAVGDASYASALANEAKTFSAAESELRKSINRILRWLTIVIPIASIMLLLSLLEAEDNWRAALQGTVAAAVAMVPDGLVLLTSLAFVAGVLELTRRNALAKQLSTVEVLARVDVLCLDKTGTITTGEIAFAHIYPLGEHTADDSRQVLAALASADDAHNATMAAIASEVGSNSSWTVQSFEPFSSARKWSAASFADRGWFYIGAPDVLLASDADGRELTERLSTAGQRLIAVAKSMSPPSADQAPPELTPLAIVELHDEIRSDAKDILSYFADQDVTVKVISGDNASTVSAIAKRAGLRPQGLAVDARTILDDDAALSESLQKNDIFGRVAPRQKQAMVQELQANGHVVAMTGDGVNDVLALKDADLGIAMGSGSAATRSVADLVLTDDAFSTLPVVVAEGRKVINNVERVANLFVTKAVYAVFLTLVIGLIGSPFPFLPRQLTLIGTFSIGIPGFFLALSPEVSRVKAGFLTRVLRFSVPAGLVAGTVTLAVYELARQNLTLAESRTLATVTLLGVGLAVLVVASRPLRPWKVALAGTMAGLYGIILATPFTREYFQLDPFDPLWWTPVAAAVAVAAALIASIPRLMPALEPPTAARAKAS